jgi:multidrug resistance efflux pump
MSEEKINEYKQKLAKYQSELQETDKQLIILEEQLKQQGEKLQEAFHTTEPTELQKISETYLKDIAELEKELRDMTQ